MTIQELIEEGVITKSQVFKAARNLKRVFTIQGCEHFSAVWDALQNETSYTLSDTEVIEEIADFVEGLR
jgi:hypothetical protein